MTFETRSQSKAKRRLRPALFTALTCVVYVPAMFANQISSPPTCGLSSLAVYLQEGSCTIGNYTLTSFTFQSSSTGEASLLSPAQITVDPTGSTLTDIALQFSAPGGFTAGAGQTAEYIFHWNLDPFFPSIGGPIINMGPNDPPTLTGEFCGDGLLSSAPGAQPVMCTGSAPTGIFPRRLQIVGMGQPASVSAQFPSLVTTMDNRLILDLNGPASVSSFGWQGVVTPTSSPEPATWMLLVSGLVALCLRKKLPRSGV
jgi:hypothetical protein